MTTELSAMLDELMGKNRNAAPDDRSNDIHWSDRDVCKHFLCGFCPAELFTNTRSDLGPCEKIHDEALRKAYLTSPRHMRMNYEEDFLHYLHQCMQDVERRIRRNHQRLQLSEEKNQKVVTPSKDVEEKINLLTQRIEEMLVQIEQLGNDGSIEEAQGVMKLCEQLKEEREQLYGQKGGNQVMDAFAVQEKQMEVCEVCGAFLIVGDAQSRVDDHLMGKQHMGYAKIKAMIEELKEKIRVKEEQKTTGVALAGAEAKRQRPEDSRERKGSRNEEANTKKRSRSRDKKPEDRSRDADRRSSRDYRSSRDGDRHGSRDRDRRRSRDRGSRHSYGDKSRDLGRRRSRERDSRRSRDHHHSRSRDDRDRKSSHRSRSRERDRRHSRKHSHPRSRSRERKDHKRSKHDEAPGKHGDASKEKEPVKDSNKDEENDQGKNTSSPSKEKADSQVSESNHGNGETTSTAHIHGVQLAKEAQINQSVNENDSLGNAGTVTEGDP